jgi:hypothetical protein
MHARLRPVLHRFVYPVFYVRLNLARLERCQSRWFGVDRCRPLSLRTRATTARATAAAWNTGCARCWRARHRGRWRDLAADLPARVRLCVQPGQLLALPRPPGRLRAVLAEVNNTFGEPTATCCRAERGRGHVHQAVARVAVLPADGHYRFRFQLTARSRVPPRHTTTTAC